MQYNIKDYDARYDLPITVTILDTVDGQTVEDNTCSGYFWCEGNGSCDCNRRNRFANIPAENIGFCDGTKRFLIIKHNSEIYDDEEFNQDYPKELINKFIR